MCVGLPPPCDPEPVVEAPTRVRGVFPVADPIPTVDPAEEPEKVVPGVEVEEGSARRYHPPVYVRAII